MSDRGALHRSSGPAQHRAGLRVCVRLHDEDDWSAAVRDTRHEPAPSVRGTTHRHGGREAAQK